MMRTAKLIATALLVTVLVKPADLSTRKILNSATIKTMVTAAEAEVQKRGVHVTICIVDDSLNLLFLEHLDGATVNTIVFAQKKARHAAYYRQPSKNAQDSVKNGNTALLAMPEAFPNQGGLPIKVDGETIGAIGVSGAASEVDEAIGQAALDAAFGK
ncbi:MAG TPA: heme-binding protein [Bryobacteraceae bacterium]|nr:heme-binding protein [Bryobacteraceae bacterium]